MGKQLLLNFLTKDMHIQKHAIDYEQLYELTELGMRNVQNMKLTPKNKEKIEKKLQYIDDLDLTSMDSYHIIDDYSITLLRIKYEFSSKMKEKIFYNNRIYRFIFEYYYPKHNIDYDEFIAIDCDNITLAKILDINIDLILQKRTSTLEELSVKHNCTRESIRLKIIEAKKFVMSRYELPKFDYVLDSDFDSLSYMDKIVILSYHDTIWFEKFKAYIIDDQLIFLIKNFEREVQKLKLNYVYPIHNIKSPIEQLIKNYVSNDVNLYIDMNNIYSLIKNGEHHNANYVLNYLKSKDINEFFIEDLLHDDFLSTKHGILMSQTITTSLRNLEAILDRENILVKVDTHCYKIESSIKNINFLNLVDIKTKLIDAPDIINIKLLTSLFSHEIEMLNIAPKGFYYLLKKHFHNDFKFRKLVIYNSDYKLQTKFELLSKDFDNKKMIVLDDSLLPNATNLARKFRSKGGLIYGDKLYNTKLLALSSKLKKLKIDPDFDSVIYRSSFNKAINDIVLDEINFKRKFAFKLWCFLHDLEYFNFYARYDSKYPELHTLVYAINDKPQTISYSEFINCIELISGSRKIYQILQNMIDSGIVDCNTTDEGRTIVFKQNNIIVGERKQNPERQNTFEVYSKLEDINLSDLRDIAKKFHIKNINKYNKKELISILRNTIKINENII